jgi:hypothetical protein
MILPERIIPSDTLNLGIVIGSYAALPYVHLHLETRRRFYPHVPALVHDDASPCQTELRALCMLYDCDFSTNSVHSGHGFIGDLRVYTAGLEWARRYDIALLVKLSRRFIPTLDWTREVLSLAMESQAPTYSSYCTHCRMGFRTECLGMHVDSWMNHGLHAAIQGEYEKRTKHFVEGYLHDRARELIGKVCLQHNRWVDAHPMPLDHDGRDGKRGYAQVAFMGTNRFSVNPHALWHDLEPACSYYRYARSIGLTDYSPTDFEEPDKCLHRFMPPGTAISAIK